MATRFDELFAALAAPFKKDEVKKLPKGGVQHNYVTARTVMNRLDEVLGPEQWWDEYVPLEHSVLCRLTVRLPDGSTLTKSDAGGYAGMADQGDDDKSAYSDALKRAAVKFGVGRYLYRDGVPQFVRDIVKGRKPVPQGPDPTPDPGPAGREPGEDDDAPGADPGTWDDFERRHLDAWNRWWKAQCAAARRDPGAAWVTLANVHQLRNAVVTLAVAEGRIEEGKILKPAEAGKPPARDPARAREALVWLYGADRDWVEGAADAYARRKAGEASHETGIRTNLEPSVA